jgi:hypothetical protein
MLGLRRLGGVPMKTFDDDAGVVAAVSTPSWPAESAREFDDGGRGTLPELLPPCVSA